MNFAFYRFSCQAVVLEKTDFKGVLAKRLAATGKSRAEFSVVIKPNFMFAYDKADHTTYTDPELVAHLDRRRFTLKSDAVHLKLLWTFTLPLRRTFFNFTDERPTWYNRFVSRVLYKLGY